MIVIVPHRQCSVLCSESAEVFHPHQEIFGKGDIDKDGSMSYREFIGLHREAEEGDESYHPSDLFSVPRWSAAHA